MPVSLSEHTNYPRDGMGVAGTALGKPLDSTSLSASGDITVGQWTHLVRIATTVSIHYAIGEDATASSPILPANEVEVVAVRPGDKVSILFTVL